MQRGIDVAKEMTNVGLARQTEGSLTSFKDSRTNRPCGESEFSHKQRMPVCKAEARRKPEPRPTPNTISSPLQAENIPLFSLPGLGLDPIPSSQLLCKALRPNGLRKGPPLVRSWWALPRGPWPL